VNTPAFESFIDQLLLDETRMCLIKGYFKTAEENVTRFISRLPGNEEGYFLLGEIYRERQDCAKGEKKRDKTKDYPAALEAYGKALNINPDYADAVKGEARVLQRKGETEKAKEFFSRYLALAPDAEDRAYIEKLLE
jgi:tetratricopeptide (TPR) repeat protein